MAYGSRGQGYLHCDAHNCLPWVHIDYVGWVDLRFVAKPMKYRDIVKRLRKHNCTHRAGKGDHVVWTSPAGKIVSIPKHREVSPGVVGDIIDKLTDLPEGWLQ
jgi:predicted RNA binding protein YcfA (HicA-like mRNA interferase family)